METKNEGSTRSQGSAGAGSSMGKDMSMSASGGTAAELHQGIDRVAEKVSGSAHAGVDSVSGALTDASKRVNEKTRQLSEAYRHFADSGRGYVRNRPATAVLTALAAGYVLSRLIGRRH
ncbi:MAG: hypothetical protein V4508_24845 [Pseudomonadota bacterium]